MEKEKEAYKRRAQRPGVPSDLELKMILEILLQIRKNRLAHYGAK